MVHLVDARMNFPPEGVIFSYLNNHPETAPGEDNRQRERNRVVAQWFANSSHAPVGMRTELAALVKIKKLVPHNAESRDVQEIAKKIGRVLRGCADGKALTP